MDSIFTAWPEMTKILLSQVGTTNKKANDGWLAKFIGKDPKISLKVPVARMKSSYLPQVGRFYNVLNITKHIDGTQHKIGKTGIQT